MSGFLLSCYFLQHALSVDFEGAVDKRYSTIIFWNYYLTLFKYRLVFHAAVSLI